MTDLRAVGAVRRTAIVVLIVLAAAIAGIIAVTREPDVIVLVGALDSFQVAVALVLVGCVTLAVLTFSLRAAGTWSRVGIILTRAAATVAVLLAGCAMVLATLEPSYVSKIVDDRGCDTGYVVRETGSHRGRQGVIYHLEGVVATVQGATSITPGATPFRDGAYEASVVDHVLRVTYASARRNAIGPTLTLALPPVEDWYGKCDHALPTSTKERS